jgi:hypothetical protein
LSFLRWFVTSLNFVAFVVLGALIAVQDTTVASKALGITVFGGLFVAAGWVEFRRQRRLGGPLSLTEARRRARPWPSEREALRETALLGVTLNGRSRLGFRLVLPPSREGAAWTMRRAAHFWSRTIDDFESFATYADLRYALATEKLHYVPASKFSARMIDRLWPRTTSAQSHRTSRAPRRY